MAFLNDIQLINSEGQISWGYLTFAVSMAVFLGSFAAATLVLLVRKRRARGR